MGSLLNKGGNMAPGGENELPYSSREKRSIGFKNNKNK